MISSVYYKYLMLTTQTNIQRAIHITKLKIYIGGRPVKIFDLPPQLGLKRELDNFEQLKKKK